MGALGVAAIAGLLCQFVWGHHLNDVCVAAINWLSVAVPKLSLQPVETIPLEWLTAVVSVLGFAIGWWILRERIRPIEENPVSGLIRFFYAARLRFALRHKLLMLSFPAFIIFVGAGAWFGFPTILAPIEKVANLSLIHI